MKKVCVGCKKKKYLFEFGKDKRRIDGYRSYCKKCINIHNQKYRQIQSHQDLQRKRRNTIIGNLRNRFYRMKQRCNNPKVHNYKNYGGRGIKVNFTSDEFIDYVINELKIDPRNLQIDRINNDGDYESGNIRFVTAKVNANNRGNNR